MGFGDLMTDMVSIYKKGGKKYEKIPASVQRGGIYITNASKILVESGDFVYRQMSNGGEEFFEVIDPGFYEALHGIPATYQMKVRKIANVEARQLLLTAKNENQNMDNMKSETWKQRLYERFEQLGYSRVKSDMEMTGGMRDIGGPPENRELAWKWLQEQEAKHVSTKTAVPASDTHIADSRLEELRALKSEDFDFLKLIRLCEEINLAYAAGACFATAMLTRAILDHIPPLFKANVFSEVANNYASGGRSFKEAMQGLENASRKISDGHLHGQIRKKEALPTPQQVNFAAQLDLLLAEIVRVFK
jgi:hypothetical protein